jgi:DNA polymerase-3 subunit delta
MTDVPIHLVKGSDAVLLDDAVRDLVDELVGDQDRSLAVEELDASHYVEGTEGSEPDISALVNAAQTPPFLTDRRVVVGRQAGVFSKADGVGGLVEYLADPLPTTSLVVVWEKGPGQKQTAKVPAPLKKAVSGAGGVEVDAGAPRKKGERAAFVATQLSSAGLKLDQAAMARLGDHVGEDLGRIGGVVETLSSTYGDGARLGLAEIEPYLVEESDLAPWDLTDAIDKGDRALALDRLHRMLNAGRHPMQLMFVLHGHYSNLLELDGAEVTSAAEAAEKLGIRNGYPAQKALELSRRLRAEQVHEAITLLAEADLDLRGVKPVEYPVMEVLVARLASRCSTR